MNNILYAWTMKEGVGSKCITASSSVAIWNISTATLLKQLQTAWVVCTLLAFHLLNASPFISPLYQQGQFHYKGSEKSRRHINSSLITAQGTMNLPLTRSDVPANSSKLLFVLFAAVFAISSGQSVASAKQFAVERLQVNPMSSFHYRGHKYFLFGSVCMTPP